MYLCMFVCSTCENAYDGFSSPLRMSARMCVLLPWVGVKLAAAVIRHFNLKCNFVFQQTFGNLIWVLLSRGMQAGCFFMMSQSRQDKRWQYRLALERFQTIGSFSLKHRSISMIFLWQYSGTSLTDTDLIHPWCCVNPALLLRPIQTQPDLLHTSFSGLVRNIIAVFSKQWHILNP